MTVPEILRAAAGEVRKGWCQRVLATNGRVCAVGAFGCVWGAPRNTTWIRLFIMNGHEDELQKLAALVLGHQSENAWNELVEWNNGSDQTAENVALTMEFAALCAEQESSVSRSEPPAVNAVAGDRETARTFSSA